MLNRVKLIHGRCNTRCCDTFPKSCISYVTGSLYLVTESDAINSNVLVPIVIFFQEECTTVYVQVVSLFV